MIKEVSTSVLNAGRLMAKRNRFTITKHKHYKNHYLVSKDIDPRGRDGQIYKYNKQWFFKGDYAFTSAELEIIARFMRSLSATKNCTRRFSLCLDCDYKNLCERYKGHLRDRKYN